jgi:uncharacterized membrane protein
MTKTQKLTVAIIAFSAIGLIDSGYLAYSRFFHSALSCSFLDGCNLVAASPYSLLFGYVPLAYLGFGFYIVMLALGISFYYNKGTFTKPLLLAFSIGGVVSSAYFVFLQLFFIKAFCAYCLASAAISVLLLLLVVMLYRSRQDVSNMTSNFPGNYE